MWKEGLTAWTPVTQVADLNHAIRAVPPELPRLTERDRLGLLPLAGPWRRFFARVIDLWAIGLPTGFLVAYGLAFYSPSFALWIQGPRSVNWLLIPLILTLEAAIFALFELP